MVEGSRESLKASRSQEANGEGMRITVYRGEVYIRRSIVATLGVSAARLEVKTGRLWGVSREERVCIKCPSGEVEDVEHLVMRYTYYCGR